MKRTNPALAALRHHVSGAIARGEKQAIEEVSLREQFVALYCQDVAENPACFKASVRENPRQYAERIIDGLNDHEVNFMVRDLRAERLKC